MSSFSAKIVQADRSLSQESNKNWVCIKWTSIAQDIQVEMTEGQHWQNVRFDFEGGDFHALSFLFFLPYMYRNVWILAF